MLMIRSALAVPLIAAMLCSGGGLVVDAAPRMVLLDPLEPLYEFLLDKGWVALYVPSARFTAGSVITPDGQDLKLDASSCFPTLKTPPAQSAALPEIEKGRDFSAETGVAFVRGLLGSVTGSIADAATAHIAFMQVKHLAVDIKKLSDAYSPACDPFLKLIRDPVVISELLAGQPAVMFKKKDSSKITLTLGRVKQLFGIKGAAKFEIIDNATLVTKDTVYFAYKAVRPVRRDGRLFFVNAPPHQLTPNYLAVWEHKISETVGRPRRPDDPFRLY